NPAKQQVPARQPPGADLVWGRCYILPYYDTTETMASRCSRHTGSCNTMGKNDMAHILIVDDDAYIAKLLSVRLERSGHSTIWASDGNQALARARAQAPDLILLDVMLPGMNGSAVLKHLKQNQATRAIPVMMLTAQTDGNSVHTGIDGG